MKPLIVRLKLRIFFLFLKSHVNIAAAHTEQNQPAFNQTHTQKKRKTGSEHEPV